jgi:hypothetical protein
MTEIILKTGDVLHVTESLEAILKDLGMRVPMLHVSRLSVTFEPGERKIICSTPIYINPNFIVHMQSLDNANNLNEVYG